MCLIGYGTYHAMKLATLIALRPTLWILSLACTELAKILCGFWSHVCEELHLNPP